jgi:hypothetical protein
MRAIPLTLPLLVMTFIGRGQDMRQYLDENLHFTTKKHAVYHATVIPDGNYWVLQAMYPDEGPILRVFFADKQLSIKDGTYTIYYRSGKTWMEGHFTNNKATGLWQSWYDNGQLRDSGQVTANHFSGEWKHWYAGGQLKKVNEFRPLPGGTSPGTPPGTGSSVPVADVIDTVTVGYLNISGIAEGRWQGWYENGRPECEGMASHGMPDSTWKWFRENGQLSSVETYSGGKIVRLECYDEQGVLTGNACSVLKPAVFTHPTLSAGEYIARKLATQYSIYRSDARRAHIQFVVTKSGKIKQIIFSGINDRNIQFQILDILNTMPAWSPAVSHNRNIDYPVSIAVY